MKTELQSFFQKRPVSAWEELGGWLWLSPAIRHISGKPRGQVAMEWRWRHRQQDPHLQIPRHYEPPKWGAVAIQGVTHASVETLVRVS